MGQGSSEHSQAIAHLIPTETARNCHVPGTDNANEAENPAAELELKFRSKGTAFNNVV